MKEGGWRVVHYLDPSHLSYLQVGGSQSQRKRKCTLLPLAAVSQTLRNGKVEIKSESENERWKQNVKLYHHHNLKCSFPRPLTEMSGTEPSFAIPGKNFVSNCFFASYTVFKLFFAIIRCLQSFSIKMWKWKPNAFCWNAEVFSEALPFRDNYYIHLERRSKWMNHFFHISHSGIDR